ANAVSRALNSNVSKDAPVTPAGRGREGLVRNIRSRRTCLYIMLLGAELGILVRMLNIVVASNRWELQRDFFDIVDALIRWHIPPPASYVRYGVRVMSRNANFYGLHTVLVMSCYWAAIGLFLASLVCLVHTGVIRDIAREKVCRYILFMGTCAGTFTG